MEILFNEFSFGAHEMFNLANPTNSQKIKCILAV